MNLYEFKFPIGKKIFNCKKDNSMLVYTLRGTRVLDGDTENDILYGIYNSLQNVCNGIPNSFEGWLYIEVWDIEKSKMVDTLELEDVRKIFKYTNR